MVSREIKKLLTTERRVTVPAFGSFMKRNDGVILFTDMFKENDGMLARALAEGSAMSDAETLDTLSQFVLKIEQSLAAEGKATLADFGVLSRSADGRIVFDTTNESNATTPTTKECTPVAVTKQPNTTSANTTEQPQTSKQESSAPVVNTQADAKPNVVEFNTPTTRTEVTTKIARPTARPTALRPQVRRTDDAPKRKTDWVLIAAIAAAVIAMAAMAYGVINSDMTSTIILE